jgi:hypothetical protein
MRTTKAFAMTKDTTSKRKTYRREDGALMVEIRPGQFINGDLAVSLGLIKQTAIDATVQNTPASRQRRQRTTKQL